MNGETLELLIVCSACITGLALLVGMITAVQIRKFCRQVREEERLANCASDEEKVCCGLEDSETKTNLEKNV